MPGMDLLVEFFRHNAMMNGRLLDACRQLSPAQLGATATGTYGSIGATLVHIANAQEGYAARFLGTERPERLEESATQVAEEREVEVIGDDPPGTWRMPGPLLLLQAVNHGTEHRSQVATILTQLGIQPPEMDGWTYFLDIGHMVEV